MHSLHNVSKSVAATIKALALDGGCYPTVGAESTYLLTAE
jgi:hypothetical protein